MLQLPLHCSFRYTPDSVPQYGAALKALIEETVGIAGGAPATLISHSMGGLQARLASPGDDAGELRRRCGDDAGRHRQASLATRLSQPGKGQLGAADQREPLDRSPGSPAASERGWRVSTGSTLASTLEQAVACSYSEYPCEYIRACEWPQLLYFLTAQSDAWKRQSGYSSAARTLTHTRTHARTHARTHTHTHRSTQKPK